MNNEIRNELEDCKTQLLMLRDCMELIGKKEKDFISNLQGIGDYDPFFVEYLEKSLFSLRDAYDYLLFALER